MPAQEEAEKSHLMNRDKQFEIPTSLDPRACTDFCGLLVLTVLSSHSESGIAAISAPC